MKDAGPNIKIAAIFSGLKWAVECSVLDCRQYGGKNSLRCHGDLKKMQQLAGNQPNTL